MSVAEVYLVRHATAEPTHPLRNDAQRNLTEQGVAEALVCAESLQVLGIVIDSIRCSPLVRAQQTAEIIGHQYALPVTVDQRLAPGFDYSVVQNFAASRTHRAVLLVAHQPDIQWIVWSATGVQQDIACASIVRLEPAKPRWRLAFSITPAVQRVVVATPQDPWTQVVPSGQPLDG
ncbi:MAG: phosphohistidine phosphatase SixA [Chloroflexota bacterium]